MNRMIKKLNKVVGMAILAFAPLAMSSAATVYYEKIDSPAYDLDGRILVTYYFNSNCPSCEKFSPIFDTWKTQNLDTVDVQEVSFSPFDDWKWASKSYNVSRKIDETIDRKTFMQLQRSSGVGAVTDILRAADVVTVATGYPRGNIMTMLSEQSAEDDVLASQMQGERHGVSGVPSLVISTADASYRISPEFNLSYDGMLKIADALIAYQFAKKAHH